MTFSKEGEILTSIQLFITRELVELYGFTFYFVILLVLLVLVVRIDVKSRMLGKKTDGLLDNLRILKLIFV
jgi:hypothetical protein